MDIFNDIEFIMRNVKQEIPTSNEPTEPLAESARNNETDQLSMSTYMTDIILDYINRSLKNEVEETEEDSQQNCNPAHTEEEEESVETLIQRAENMIRENMQERNIAETITAPAIDELISSFNAQEGSYIDVDCSSIQSIQSTSNAHTWRPPPTFTAEVISVDTDSDDEVIFVQQSRTEIPVIDLSDLSSPENTIEQSSTSLDNRKRTRDCTEINCDSVALPVEKSSEKRYRHSCAICLEDLKSPHSTICGHVYCGVCIKNALKIFKKCPSCNKKLKANNIHPIYL